MIASEAGAITFPIANGRARKNSAMTHHAVAGVHSATLASIAATATIAVEIWRGAPTRTFTVWLSAEPATRPSATGSIWRPVASADLPCAT